MNLDKLVASNTLNANRNIMVNLTRQDVSWWVLYNECEEIIKRYPSLA